MNKLSYLISGIIIVLIAPSAFCGWQELIIVNDSVTNKQASRDSDCPWPISADNEGNIYTVWEDFRDTLDGLQIYFRARSYDGTWDQSAELISVEPNWEVNGFGHPSICVVPSEGLKLLASYVAEDGPSSELRELRGNTFESGLWEESGYLISDSGTYQLPFARTGWGTNLVALSDGKAYAFWQYDIDSNVRLYFNEYDNGWVDTNEAMVYTFPDSGHYSQHPNACVDTDDTIHLLYSDEDSTDISEIYHLDKTTLENDFGSYPGYQVSSSSGDTSAIMPYCTISSYENTDYLHVVWCTHPAKRIFYRKKKLANNAWSSVIDTIAPANETSYAPSIASDSYRNIHVVWQKEDNFNGSAVTKYRKYDAVTKEWNSVSTLPADTSAISDYGLPVIISDIFDNLHVLMTGMRTGASGNDEEVYYSFWDAPPHAPQNLAQVFIGPPEYITITWDANSEPDLDGYMIIRRYHEKTWLDTLATVDDTVTTYVDTEIPHVGGETPNYVRYWIEAIDIAGQHSPKSDSLECAVPKNWEPPKLIADGSIPTHFELTGNYPNPFNAVTEIQYALPFNAHVTLEIYDILGRKTVTLIDEYQEAGFNTAHWNGQGANASEMATGIYIYRLSAGGLTQSKRMLLLK